MSGRKIALILPVLMTVVFIAIVGWHSEPAPALPEGDVEFSAADPPSSAGKPPETSTSESPVEAVAPSSPRSGWLRITLDLDGLKESGSFRASAIDREGSVEESVSHTDLNQFDLGPLSPGLKAVLLYSPGGLWSPMTATATIIGGADTSIVLRISKPVYVEGRVVDARGTAVDDVLVESRQMIPFPDGFVPVLNEHRTGGGGGARTAGSRRLRSVYSYSYTVDANGVTLTQGFGADREGRFRVPAKPGSAPLVLRVRRGAEILREEAVLPSAADLRIVIPGAAEAPK
ncbi:MAG TPA: hypothetical protein VE981_11765 [Planctomycetota bacterium]|nr:hypothetical protein [Planctomycetota bacterium]